ncbi:MipA/OmpV family protein [Luteibacter aegosomaticola]|uniref:MipA/OmpV family protein n=1 Tax=Luteibacter aegosomaticola TaxID=2911538 RepID=UPI001FF86DDB|nr:MipA/OmpV family protein [Luteibacter aegosomaticola]UPG88508.1 MipA/OmpV family protein [Luteibacter aegosomaticola]
MARKLMLCGVSVLTMASCFTAHAQDRSEQGKLSLGLGVAWSPSPYRSYDNKAWPLPVASYEGQRFFLRGPSFGARLWNSSSSELAVALSPIGNRFRHEDSRNSQLRQLKDRDLSAQLGLQWQTKGTWGRVALAAQKEVTGHGGGHVFDANYSYAMPFGSAVVITPMVGVAYTSSALNDYYYGVSRKEALRSGLPAYRSGSSSAPYAGASAFIKLGARWSAVGTFRYSRLADEISDSPMVHGDSTVGYSAALMYRF